MGYTAKKRTITGLERVISGDRRAISLLAGRRLGLLCNQASVDSRYRHASRLLRERFGKGLTCLFSPQHGLFSEKQDNMKESCDERDPFTGLPVFSLYGKTRTPTPEQLSCLDILLVDLQDVGCRVYTYIWTVLNCMKACAQEKKALVVLDRPNPIGGVLVEGPILEPGLHSFVGMAPIPLRHGMTVGELALMFRDIFSMDLELHVIEMEGWQRPMPFQDTGLAWVLPSPNMPSLETSLVYPGQVILETVNISEGRGTTRPFEIFGAPFLEPERVLEGISCTDGAVLREQFFEPTFNKYEGMRCRGFQIHVTDPTRFRPVRFTLDLLSLLWRLYPDDMAWTPPPYEYEFEKLPADLVIGNSRIRKMVEEGSDIREIESRLREDEAEFASRRTRWFIYRQEAGC